MIPALLEAFRRGLSCQPESGHCDVGCDACLTNALRSFLAARGALPAPAQDQGELLEATEPLCREMMGKLRHRIFTRSNKARFIVRDGQWAMLNEPLQMTGALVAGDETPARYRYLNGQWPVPLTDDDCERMLDVWRRPVAVITR